MQTYSGDLMQILRVRLLVSLLEAPKQAASVKGT